MVAPETTRRELALPTVKMDRNHIPIFRSIQDYLRRNKTYGASYYLANAQAVSSSTWSAVNLDTKIHDDHPAFRSATDSDRMTVPMAGWYAYSANLNIGDNVLIGRRILRIGKGKSRAGSAPNGIQAVSSASIDIDLATAYPNRVNLSTSGLVYMDLAFEWLNMWGWHDEVGAGTANFSKDFTRFTVVKLPL